jgi:cytochrome c biogenesis protein
MFMVQKGPENRTQHFSLWIAFSSIKLTLFLLILLAVTSIFGTLIPQQESAMRFAENLSPSLVRILDSLQLFDMYHSWWFRLTIGALAVNLIVCSLDRFPSSLKRFRSSPNADREKPFENLPPEQSFPVKSTFESVSNHVGDLLRDKYGKIERKDKEQATFYLVQKGRFTHFGVYLVHFSVLLILVGGIAGSLFGFQAFVNIPEGEGIDRVLLRKSRVAKPLPFSVRCDKFTVEFYPNGTPKEYRSDLVFVANGEVALQGPLRVNHPITFQGITFYQSTYGTLPGNQVRLTLKREDDGQNALVEAQVNKPFPLPGQEGEAAVTAVRSDFMRLGPAVQLEIRPSGGEDVQLWVFKNHAMIEERFPGIFERFPRLNPASFKPYTFFLESMDSRYYTGLQVSRDPGVPLVWAGFVTIIIGLFATFFLSHRMIWVRVSRHEKGANVALAGMSSKNVVGLEREMSKLMERIRREMKRPPSS